MAKVLAGSGGVRFFAGHPVLADVARDLVHSLGEDGPGPVDVHVGVHRNKAVDRTADTPLVGLQTEQIIDTEGRPMWKAVPPERIAEIVDRFDVILDLSDANAPAYDFLPGAARQKVRFGPHIFPQTPPGYRPRGQGLVFVGNVNRRRADLLENIGADAAVTIVPGRTFGRALSPPIRQSAGVLNLHFQDGVYTEYPRLLKTVLHGKPLFSERLAPPLVAGLHYFAPTDRPTPDQAEAGFDALTRLLCGRYSLAAFLRQVAADPLDKDAA